MNEPTEKPAEEHHGRQREDDPAKEEASARPRWYARLVQGIKAGIVVVLDAGIRLLERLKPRADSQMREESREERAGSKHPSEAKHSAEPRHPPEQKKTVEPALPLPMSRLRRTLTDVMLMLMVAIVGMGLAYLLLAKVLSEQSSKIRTQSEEISAYSQENQEKATRIAELMRELDKQRANLTEIEKRLSETVVKLPEPEIRAAELKNPVPKSATARTGQPSQSSTFTSPIPAKSGNCDLLVGEKSAEELKRCIDNYNRK